MSGTDTQTESRPLLEKRFAVECEEGIAFGQGGVGFTQARGGWQRPLLLDVYAPRNDDEGRPALIMAFGGAFHRGTRTDDCVRENGISNTAVASYCREFARRGYVCYSIDYRLVPDDPDPGSTRVVADVDSVPRSRVDVVREILGLPLASADMLWRGVEAASDDFAAAWRFVVAHASRWRVDPARVAVGGFSAGARSAWNAAFGEGIDAAAVVSISGTMHPDDLQRCLDQVPRLPPLLLVRGEHDLDYVREQNPVAVAACGRHGVEAQELVVPGLGHFYPATVDVAKPGDRSLSLEGAIAEFLAKHLSERPSGGRGR